MLNIMNLSKREYVALEILKKLARKDNPEAVSQAYSMADEFIAEANACEEDAKNHGLDSETTLDRLFGLNIDILELSDKTLRLLRRKDDRLNFSTNIFKIGELVILERNSSFENIRKDYQNELSEVRHKLGAIGLKTNMSKAEMYDYDSSEYVRITKDNDGELMLRLITS